MADQRGARLAVGLHPSAIFEASELSSDHHGGTGSKPVCPLIDTGRLLSCNVGVGLRNRSGPTLYLYEITGKFRISLKNSSFLNITLYHRKTLIFTLKSHQISQHPLPPKIKSQNVK
jgi:hypothetical protein